MKTVRLSNGQILNISEAVREDTACIIQYLENIPYDTDSDGNPNSPPVANLTYTQALILLGTPEKFMPAFSA